MASLEYLTQNSLIAYPFNRSQPSAGAQTLNPIQDNWFYDILFASYAPNIRSVYVSLIEKTTNGDVRIQFSNSETLLNIGAAVVIPSDKVKNHLQNKLDSFFSHQNALFSVKFIIGEGLVIAPSFTQNYDPKEAELASGAIVLSPPKLLNLAAKAYVSQILPGGEIETTVALVKNFSEETYNPLITLQSNIEVLIDSPHTIGTYTPDPSTIELTVDAGKGTGPYDACPPEDQIEDLYTINKISPDTKGSFYVKPSPCHTLNTLSENDRVYYTSTDLLENYSPEIIIANHSLLLENHCQSKCPRENINAFAHYLNRVGDGLKELNEIVFNSIETRGVGTPNVDIFNAEQFCNEGTEENPDPFLRCFEHTEPIDTFIDCNSTFRKYYHEFRTLQIFYDDLTIRNYTILEVIDDNSVRLDNPPTAGNSLWFRVKDNGVISNLNCATLTHNIQAEQNKYPYYKIKYTTREAYDSDNNYVTLVGLTLAIFNPSKTPVAISAVFAPTVLVRKGNFKIRKADSIEDNDSAEVTLNCREYAFIDAVFSIPCGVTGGIINTEVFQILGEELVTLGEVHTINNIAGALCPGEDFSGASTFRITKSGWQAFSGKFSTGIYSVNTVRILGDIPPSNWVSYQVLNNEHKIEVKAAFQPTETLSRKYSTLFKSTTTTNTIIYNRVILDYIAPPIIVFPLSSNYDEESPLMLGKNETYTEASPAFKISASNMQYSGDVATDEDDFYYEVTGLPDGLSLNSLTGSVIGTVDSDVQTGQNIEINITAHNASGEATNPQTVYLKLAIQDPPQITFDPSTPGDVFNISNFDTFTTVSPVFKVNATNLPIYLYTIYPIQGTTGLPAGLYFDQSLGVITGKITATTSGTGIFDISATNLYGESVDRLRFTLNYEVYAKPSIIYPTANTIVSTNISIDTDIDNPLFTVAALQAFGGEDNYADGLTDTTRNKYTAPAWNNVTGIPPGYYLDLYSGRFYGKIDESEIPTDPLITSYILSYPITISASNPVGVTTVSMTLQVANDTVPVIINVNTVRLVRNNTYTQQAPLFRITATNNPTSFSADNLPSGLSCTSDGYIIGTVNNTLIAGSYLVIMRAFNANGAAVPLNCEVRVPVSIVSVIPAGPYNLTVNSNYENIFTVTTSGLKDGDTITLTNSTPPPGLFFASSKLYGTPTTRGNYTFRVTATSQNYSYAIQDIPVVVTVPTYTISGTVVDDLNSPVSGVTVTVSTGLTGITDSQGKYSIPLIPAGVYNVRAAKANTLSTPTIQSMTLPAPFGTPQPALNAVNFVCVGPFRTIIGKLLKIGTSSPLAGLRVSDGYRTDTTDSFGTFELQVSYNAVPLTVTSTTYVFPTTTIPAGSESIDNIVIYGQIGYTVSGQISCALDFESNMTVTITNISSDLVYTIQAENLANIATYSIKIPGPATYSIAVTDSLGLYNITTAPNFTLSSAKTINFTANRVYSISGVVKATTALPGDVDILIPDVLITVGNKTTLTNSEGYFILTKFLSAVYSIIASKENLSFSPTAITLDQEDLNVEIFPSYLSISGGVYHTTPNLKIAGPIIKLRKKEDDTLIRTVTATDTGYSIEALIPGEYVLSAELPGCVLSLNNSEDGSVTLIDSNLSDKNFTFLSFPETPPNVPTITTIVKLLNGFRLTVYTEPSPTTSPVIKYDYSTDGGSTWTAVTQYVSPLTFDALNLAINTTYILKVRAYNLYSSTESIAYTARSASAPDAPVISNVITKPGGEGFLIYFEAPSTSELPVTRYDWRRTEWAYYLEAEETGWSDWMESETAGDVISPVATGLYYGGSIFIPGRTYGVQIRARNIVGIGPRSTAFYPALVGAIPDAPGSFEIVYVTQNNLNITFNVGYNGGENITDIEYYIRQGEFSEADNIANYISTGKTPDSMAIETLNFLTLANGTYTLQVRSVNVVGKGSWALFVFSKAWYPLVAPSIVSITPRSTAGDIYLNTTELNSTTNNGGIAIDRYRFFVGEELTTAALELPANSAFYRLTGLVNGTEATVRVAAVNKANFQGPLSAPQHFTPSIGAPADAPLFVTQELTDSELSIIFEDASLLKAGGDESFLNIETEITYSGVAPCEENPEELCTSQLTMVIPIGALTLNILESGDPDKYVGSTKTIYNPIRQAQTTTGEAYQFVDFIPGSPLVLRFRFTNSHGLGPWSTPLNYILGLPGRIATDSVTTSSGASTVSVYINYDPGFESVNESTAVEWALQRIIIEPNTTTSTAVISGVSYKFKRTTSTAYYSGEASNIEIFYTIADTANWQGVIASSPTWQGQLEHNPNWAGSPVLDEFGDILYYDYNDELRNLDNEGLYYNNDDALRNLDNGGLFYDTSVRTLENGGQFKDYSANKLVFNIDLSPFEITEPYDLDLRLYTKSENGTSEKYTAKKAERLPPASVPIVSDFYVGYNLIAFNITTELPGNGEGLYYQHRKTSLEEWQPLLSGLSLERGYAVFNIPQGTYTQFSVRNVSTAGVGKSITLPSFAVGAPDAPIILCSSEQLSQLKIVLSPPVDNGGSVVTGYMVKTVNLFNDEELTYSYRNNTPNGEFKTSNLNYEYFAGSSVTITRYPLGSGLYFKVYAYAYNARGFGGTASTTFLPISYPGPITDISYEGGDRQILLKWKAGNTGGLSGGFKLDNVTIPGDDYIYTYRGQEFALQIPFPTNTWKIYFLRQYHAFTAAPQAQQIYVDNASVYSLAPPIISNLVYDPVSRSIGILFEFPSGFDNWAHQGPGAMERIVYNLDTQNDYIDPEKDVTWSFGSSISEYLGAPIQLGFTYFLRFKAYFQNSLYSAYTPVLSVYVPPIPQQSTITAHRKFTEYLEFDYAVGSYISSYTITVLNANFAEQRTVLIGDLSVSSPVTLTICRENCPWINFTAASPQTISIVITGVNISGESSSLPYNILLDETDRFDVLRPPLVSIEQYFYQNVVTFQVRLQSPTCGGPVDDSYVFSYKFYNSTVSRGLSVTRISPGIWEGNIPAQQNSMYYIQFRRALSGRTSEFGEVIGIKAIGLPKAPTNLSVTPADKSIIVSFTPSVVNGIPVEYYTYQINDSGDWKTLSVTPAGNNLTGVIIRESFTNALLVNGTTYTVKIAAYAQGLNAASTAKSVTVCTVPSKIPVSAITSTLTSRKIVINISPAPNNGGGTITKYSYSLDGGQSYELSTSATLPLTITKWQSASLENATNYLFKIRAVNAAGTGEASESVPLRIIVPPSKPLNLTTTVGDKRITVAFNPPADNGGGEITNYEYSTNDGIAFIPLSPANPTPTVSGIPGLAINITTVSTGDGTTPLVNGTPYVVKLRASNVSGAGAASTYVVAIPIGS